MIEKFSLENQMANICCLEDKTDFKKKLLFVSQSCYKIERKRRLFDSRIHVNLQRINKFCVSPPRYCGFDFFSLT